METKPHPIVDKMMQDDAFSQWLGIERIDEGAGYCSLKMMVREQMCNGFGIAHGGISFSLADSAMAFAANAHGQHALSIETSISHFHRIVPNSMLFAHAKEISKSSSVGYYEVRIENEEKKLMALFKGCVYFSSAHWH